ncbi:MAG TPA: sulfatase [Actinomycetes bacterium]
MRRIAALMLAPALVLGMLAVDDTRRERSAAAGRAVEAADVRTVPPDVVLILTDDQRRDTLTHMRAVREHLRDKGTRFSRTVAPTPTCCPSRASILTGLVARHTGVYGNTPPDGGWRTFFDNGLEERTLATALQARGYRTGLFGKYFNGFAQNELGASAGHRPPGWNTFLTFKNRTGGYHDYTLTDGSRFGSHAEDYSTDVLGARAARFIRSTAAQRPLFVMFTPFGPHKPYRPARRHLHDYADLPSYRPRSVTEDVADKPPFLSDRPRVKQATIDFVRARQQEQLSSVDDAVAGLVRALRQTGRLHNTLLVYMSDNGLMIGDHHMIGKDLPYRFATDVPLVIRWDGRIDAGRVDRRLAATIDVTATIAEAAGADMTTDGLSLLDEPGRSDLLLEGRKWKRLDGSVPHPAFCGLRSTRYLFVRYADGFEELYDYRNDPYEARNRAADPEYSSQVSAMRARTMQECVPTPPGYS